jgi:hypothetical protein
MECCCKWVEGFAPEARIDCVNRGLDGDCQCRRDESKSSKFKRQVESFERHVAKGIKGIEALHLESEEKLKSQIEKLKQRVPAGRLPDAEMKQYKILCDLLNSEKPLGILTRMLKTEQTETGWRVLASDNVTWYEVPDDLSFCPCPIPAQTCPHLSAIRLLTRIRFAGVRK